MNSSQPPIGQPKGERLSKRVMQLKNCSRREAEQYIESGFVRVDGEVIEQPQFRVSDQSVAIDADATLINFPPVTLLLHKPAGWLDDVDKGDKSVSRFLTPSQQCSSDRSGVRILNRHFHHLQNNVPLEYEASGLVVFSQDFRVQRKLIEDVAVIEHELIVDVRGEVLPDQLRPIERAMRDDRLRLPDFKISVGSSNESRSKLRLAVKGSHLGLAVYLCELAELKILALHRTRLGRVNLGDLEVGRWRYLENQEKF
jgi:23S rRNA pseudouridine2604 synthase